jgi:pyrroloquinoline quinone (PQQ) biosynthesis protein C
MYSTTHATPPLMREASSHFAAAGRGSLARWAETKALEEDGHDTLALLDLAALGHDAARLVERVRPEVGQALVAYFAAHARAPDPVACVGYAYALERLALEIDAAQVARVEAVLPPGVRATRCLRVHSAHGSDRRHVSEAVAFVATLSPDERTAIARAVYETAAICARRPDDDLTDDEIHRRLREPPPTERSER